MKINSFACDGCNVHKQSANHWFKGYKRAEGGIVIIRWEDVPPTDDVEDFEAHLCGAECVTEWVSKNLF